MWLKTFVLLLFIGILVTDALEEKPRKFKKAKYEDKKYLNLQEKLERLQEEEAALEAELEEELEEEIDLDAGSVSDIIDFPSISQNVKANGEGEQQQEEEEEELEDPCAEIYCGAGRDCIINEDREGECQCVEKCENIDDDRRKVCSNHNETWPSDCELYRMRCLCSEGSEECTNEKFEHVHIDYYGNCQKVPECEKDEMKDFPRRMREWLFNIMRDMADRKELSDKFLEIEKNAEEDIESKKWTSAAVWKWCELDGHPKDRAISRHELFPLRAPLYTLEHCIAPFLNSCDPDDDHYITLKEWSHCLELTDELSEDMEELCEEIRE